MNECPRCKCHSLITTTKWQAQAQSCSLCGYIYEYPGHTDSRDKQLRQGRFKDAE